jgi:hypothetical protein
MKKSYHSMVVPMALATATRRACGGVTERSMRNAKCSMPKL